MSTILDKIIDHKKKELAELKSNKSTDEVKKCVKNCQREPMDISFFDALNKKGSINIIAEVKKGSPSKGIICEDFDPVSIAKQYEIAGAGAVSVLTDSHFFFGKLQYLKDIRKAISLPILRKDFIIDEYQIYEAKCAGANAILLIAAVLDKDTIQEFLDIARKLDLDALVEVHNKSELDKVLKTDARIIGVNNRNLKDFSVDLNTTAELVKDIPPGKVVVSESGIHTRADIEQVLSCGVNSFLIGEALVKDNQMAGKMAEFLGK
ncbi:indole-3-glycerol phosphate synthase TrpC [Thermodesulfobacteriota bacterium]